MSDLNGQTVAGYPIQKLLGKGSYVELYEAQSSASPLAVRVLREDLRANTLLRNSVLKGWEAARTVQHASIKVMYSTGDDPAVGVYCLEEMIAGKSLRQMLLGGSKVAWRDCLILAEQLFAALVALHAARNLHGEIWPGGILITQDQDLKLEGAGGLTLMNTPIVDVIDGPALGYLAPEIVEGSPLSIESDIYSAGAVLHFIMAGQDPFPGEDPELIARSILEKKPTPLSALRDDVPAEAEAFIARLMAKDATQRPGVAADVLADIQRLKDGEPVAALKGGKPPAPPRPSRKTHAPDVDADAVVGHAAKGKSGTMPATGNLQTMQEKRVSGAALGAVGGNVNAKSGFLSAVKGGPSNQRVFGRLETHVKSTIPQSDTEKRADDFYRQGQLPLALANWREAFNSGTPHAALKIKIELGERELKKEAYTSALDEARHRIDKGDFKGAVLRAREAMMNADTEQQRGDAIKLEQEAIVTSKTASQSGNAKTITAVVGFIVLVIFVFKFFAAAPAKDDGGETQAAPTPDGKAPEIKAAGTVRFHITIANASIVPSAHWVVQDGTLQVPQPGTKAPAVTFRVVPHNGTTAALKLDELRKNNGLENGIKIEDVENFSIVDSVYPASELGFRYAKPDGAPALRYIYFVGGPQESLYAVEFDGVEKVFDMAVRSQMRPMILSWKYQQK